MNQGYDRKLVCGLLLWIGLAIAAVWGIRLAQQKSPVAMDQLTSHLLTSHREVHVEFPRRQLVAFNDPVFLADSESAAPIGRVSRLGPPPAELSKLNGDRNADATDTLADQKIAYVQQVTVTLYGAAPTLSDNATFTQFSTPQSTDWVVRTMLPPEKRREIVSLMMDAYRLHMPEIAAAFEPLVKESLSSLGEVLRQDLRTAIAARADQFQAIGKRYESELLEKRVLPVLQDEVWPLVEAKGKPLASQIGAEIWQELSLWRFGWRYVYDKSPLPKRNFTEGEFNRFVQEKAAPIVKAHLPDILEVQQELLGELSQNDRVRETIRNSFQAVVEDDEVQDLLASIFRQVAVDNKNVRSAIEEHWTSDRAHAAIDLAGRRLDPTINAIGEAMFGNPNKSITPEFARVVRRMVLHKDQRWLVLEPGSTMGEATATKSLERSAGTRVYPATVSYEDAIMPSPVSLPVGDAEPEPRRQP